MASKRTPRSKKKAGKPTKRTISVTIDLDELERLYRHVHGRADGDGDTKSGRARRLHLRLGDGDTK